MLSDNGQTLSQGHFMAMSLFHCASLSGSIQGETNREKTGGEREVRKWMQRDRCGEIGGERESQGERETFLMRSCLDLHY